MKNRNGAKGGTAADRTSKNEEDITIPALCQFWRGISNRLPIVRVWGSGGLNVSMTLASAVALAAVRYAAEFTMVTVFSWPHNAFVTKNAAASAAAMIHSVSLVPALAVCFYAPIFQGKNRSFYNPSQKMSEAPVWWQETVAALLQFCTGYMLYDGLLNIIWLKSSNIDGQELTSEDALFLGHHVATILYMTSVRLLACGHQSAMICMLLGELTNPLHNAFYIAQAAQTLDCCNGPVSQAMFVAIKVAFSALYCLVRIGVGPVFFAHVTYNTIVVGRTYIPWAVILLWNVLIWAVVFGSIPWVKECWSTLQQFYSSLLSSYFGGETSDSGTSEL